MTNGEELGNTNSDEPTGWEGLREAVDRFEERRIDMAPEVTRGAYRNILEYQRSFETRSQTLADSGERMSKKEFEKWEDLVSDEYKRAKREEQNAGFEMQDVAESAQYMITSSVDSELSKTVEAQSAHFYYQRMSDLKEAIDNTGGDSDDLEYVKSFYPAVAKHLDFKYMSRDDVANYGFKEYEESRTRSHNGVIEHMNGLNDLARKYGVRPLTFRNFWPSDLKPKDEQTPAEARVLRYDRDIVEEYYAIAFSSEVRRRNAKQARDMKYGF